MDRAPTDCITLEELRDYARDHADTPYDLDHCFKCLAAEATGKHMYDHRVFMSGGTVPDKFAVFSSVADSAPYTGAELADALDKIIGGADPILVALDLKASKNVVHPA